MKFMHSKRKLPSHRSIEIDMCEDFQKNGRTPKKERLELIHYDVRDPTIVSSIDDNSRKVWI